MTLTIVGRSSSHFTRVARMFAVVLGVVCGFEPVADLGSRALSDYAGNPALKIPVLQTPDGPWFGAINVCRELARRASNAPKILWPEQLVDRAAANAQELVLQAMSTEVTLIMQAPTQPGGAIATSGKAYESLVNSLVWLDENLSAIRAKISSCEVVSLLDLTAYCFVTHLEFRQVTDVSPYRALQSFCVEFGQRPSAQATTYFYDNQMKPVA